MVSFKFGNIVRSSEAMYILTLLCNDSSRTLEYTLNSLVQKIFCIQHQPIELPVMMKIFCTHDVQYGSHDPRVVIEHVEVGSEPEKVNFSF